MRFIGLFVIAAMLLLAGCASSPQNTPNPEENVTGAPANSTTAPPTQMANPASVYCMNNRGNRLEIREGATGQVGYCIFKNGRECEEWSYFRGECNENGTARKKAALGGFCGGIASFQCQEGLVCRLDGSYPDSGGLCVEPNTASEFKQCLANRQQLCTQEYAPVCGRAGETPSMYNFVDYPNACVACSTGSGARGYFDGTCAMKNLSHKALVKGELYYCPSARSETCAKTADPVCGRIVSGDSEVPYYQDFASPCEACAKASNAIAYYVGNCTSR
ncbi:MAG: DUF333 domain-containing protein [Candidatus Micrarchaeota archaeon]|nr:DUF333 domain-containing protein [Candidatus Micrarchaeota archaeon]